MQRNMDQAYNSRRYMPWLDGLGFSLQLITLGLGGFLVIKGHMTLGNLVAFNSYLWMIDGPSAPIRLADQRLATLQRVLHQDSQTADRRSRVSKKSRSSLRKASNRQSLSSAKSTAGRNGVA